MVGSLAPVEAVARLASLPGVGTASGVAAAAVHDSVTGKLLPVLPELAGVLPFGGLRRGSTVSVGGSRSLLLALLAEATTQGSWAAVVGMPDLGVVAAAELGVETSRLALVPAPGSELVPVTAALLDGVDLVVVGCGMPDVRAARQLSARARHRGAVLLAAGTWPGAEVELRCVPGLWNGIDGAGHGYLREREVTAHGCGRGAAARPARARFLLPGPGGQIAGSSLVEVEQSLALEVG
ncbi:MAG: hypothetical protein ACRDQ7_05435 [Haloechinothrix sp.]